ncbi:hypothetical protein Tco_1046116 [Tanacetum coccineum]
MTMSRMQLNSKFVNNMLPEWSRFITEVKLNRGPFQMGTFIQTPAEDAEETEGALQLGPERARVFTDLSAEEKERYKADIRATNILLQGIPKDNLTHSSTLYCCQRHLRKCEDDSGRFWVIRSFINDMRNYQMTPMSRMQLNSKFVNNMLPEWSRFITEVKLNRGLKESNFDQLYAYLKQHEVHANENKMMIESTSTDNLIESLTNTLALLNQSFKAHLPQMNNQLRTSSNARNNATVQDGRVVVQDVRGQLLPNPPPNRDGNGNLGQANPLCATTCKGIGHTNTRMTKPKRPQDSDYFKDKMLFMKLHVDGSNVSSVRNDALMSILDEIHEQGVQVACKRCRICTIFSVVSWIISGPNSTNGETYFFDVQPGKGFHLSVSRVGISGCPSKPDGFGHSALTLEHDDSGSHNRNLQAILTNGVASCLILSDEEYVEGFFFGQMAHLVASITLNSTRSGSIRFDSLLALVLYGLVIIVVVVGLVFTVVVVVAVIVVVVESSSVIKLSFMIT